MNEATNNNSNGDTNMTNLGYIISGTGSITIVIGKENYTVGNDHKNYRAIVDCLKSGDTEDIERLLDIGKAITDASSGNVTVVDGQIVYGDQVLHNSLTNRILTLVNEDLPFKFMLNFLDNLMENPSFRAVNELYGFLEYAQLPITEDGHFLAYKRVRDDYKDIHSGTLDNSVGQIVEVSRNMVDEDCNRTCSSGLHFCSIEYLPHFGRGDGNRVMILKINPADVVAIPADYNNTKGRCCRYEVIAEHETYDNLKDKDENNAFTQPVYNKDGSPYEGGVFDEDGLDEEGFDRDGYDEDGYDRAGYNRDGYDETGYDRNGYDADGYDEDGWDEDGYNCYGQEDIGDRIDDQLNELNEQDTTHSDYGVKPSGQRFYNHRVGGKFAKK